MARDNLILDRYEPLGMAGEGGFGTVQIAWDPRIQRKVAIKTIKLTELDAYRANLPGAQATSSAPEPPTFGRWHGVQPWSDFLASEDGKAERAAGSEPGPFPAQVTSLSHLPGLDEARTAAMLADSRIVTVYDFEIRDRFAYLIMEYVEGITLARLLDDYPDVLTLDMVTAVFDAMAGALSVAHAAGVLHLDIKPDNIIINLQGQAKVTDFGLATLADASGAGTTGGGTIGYMPLEQMRREHLDARTDEWSLASVLYEMLTGDNPFRAGTLAEAEGAIENAELVLPSLCWEGLDGQIDDVVFYALDPDRDERYASVPDFAEEADKFLGDAEAGKGQLALVVADALGLAGEDGEGEGALEDPADERPRQGLLSRVFGFLDSGVADSRAGSDGAGYRWDDVRDARDRRDVPDGDGDDAYDEPALDRAERQPRANVREHEPLVERISPRMANVLARAFAAASSAFTAWLAFANMPLLSSAFGSGAAFVTIVAIAVVAALGAILPHIGALSSFALLGIAIVACGHPVVGGVLIGAVVLWWCFIAREGPGPANVALTSPLLGAVGGASAVPLVAGAALRPAAAIFTTALAAGVALVLGSLGAGSLLGWDAPAHWDFTRVDITANLVALAKQPATWATIAGWAAAAAAFSPLAQRRSRALAVIGLAVAVAFVLAGALVLAAPTPQLIVSVAVTAAVLLAVLL